MTDSAGRRAQVCIVDDDESVREALPDLLRQSGFSACAFASADDFLAWEGSERVDCLILDVAMRGMTGPQLQTELKRRGLGTPIIFITAHADAHLRSQLMAQGAVECLTKPFGDIALLHAIDVALSPA